MSETDALNTIKSNRLLVNNFISYFKSINYQPDRKSIMQVATGFLFICMFLTSGVSSTYYNQVKIPEPDFQNIVNNLQMKYRMNYDDAKNCVLELEHFYTGIKYKIIDSILDHPQTAIKNAWETHIVYTSMYFNFTHSTFGTYIHYKPTEQDKGQLHVYDKLKKFGINNMNETVWLLKTLQPQEDYSSPASWNTYYMQSSTLSSFNGKVNKCLKKFIEEYNPPSHNFQVLDIAMGQGRNSIWLAQKGYNVTGFDSSIEGIQVAKNQAKQLNLTIQAYVKTIEEFQFGSEQWDLIVCMYFPIINETSYLRKIEQSLKYKGLLIVEVFHWDGLSGESTIPIDVTYKTNVIPSLFPNLTIITYEEPIDYSDFGNQPTKIIRYVGQKQYSHACS
jgi:2-polyprenyl-3-methyl-5-hydroxy-6-metoxy-1,4-benzoquinol methylase